MNDYKVFEFPELDSSSRLRATILEVNRVVLLILSGVVTFYIINTFFILETHLDNGFYRLLLLLIVQVLSVTIFKNWHYKKLALLNMSAFYACFFLFPFLDISRRFEENIYIPLTLMIVAMVLPTLFYSIKKDFKLIIAWLVLVFLTVVVNLFYQRSIASPEEEMFFFIFSDHPMTIFGLFAAIIFIIAVFISYRKYDAEQHEIIRELNQELNSKLLQVYEKNNEKETQNEEMKSIQEELLAINEELERKVAIRAQELEERQRKIVHFGFMNSHILRASVARVKGLMNIIEVMDEKTEREAILKMIEQSIFELDGSSKAIREIIDERDAVYLKEIEAKVEQLYGKG